MVREFLKFWGRRNRGLCESCANVEKPQPGELGLVTFQIGRAVIIAITGGHHIYILCTVIPCHLGMTLRRNHRLGHRSCSAHQPVANWQLYGG